MDSPVVVDHAFEFGRGVDLDRVFPVSSFFFLVFIPLSSLHILESQNSRIFIWG